MTNVIFHIVNTLLLFIVLRRMTGTLWQSGFVAALFALHPLHVESVAWVAERKDLLNALFGLLVLWFYMRYVQAPTISRYVPVLSFFILGLMAKPMMVTLPFLLLLLDYWPLRRLDFETASKIDRSAKRGPAKWFWFLKNYPCSLCQQYHNLVCSTCRGRSCSYGCVPASHPDYERFDFLCKLYQ